MSVFGSVLHRCPVLSVLCFHYRVNENLEYWRDKRKSKPTIGPVEFIDRVIRLDEKPGLRPDPNGALFIGIDASVKHDSTALACVKYDQHSDNLVCTATNLQQAMCCPPVFFWQAMAKRRISLLISTMCAMRIYNPRGG
jgi:hypothetical protein